MSDRHNLFLPPGSVDKIIAAACPPGFHVAKDARCATHTIANLFVMMLSTLSGDIAQDAHRIVVQRSDVEKALENAGWEHLLPALKAGPGVPPGEAQKRSGTTPTTTAPAAPRKPSAYLLFSSEHRKTIVAANPGMKMTDVQKALAEKWRSLTEEERKAYHQAPKEEESLPEKIGVDGIDVEEGSVSRPRLDDVDDEGGISLPP